MNSLMRVIFLLTSFEYSSGFRSTSFISTISNSKRLKSSSPSSHNFKSKKTRQLNILQTLSSDVANSNFDIENIDFLNINMDFSREYIESAKHYGSALSNSPTLVLNADYKPLSHLPLSLWNWQDSVRAVFADKAVVVSEYPISIRSVSYEMKLPSVIALKQFRKNPIELSPGMTRKKVFIRDSFKCQYCLHSHSPDKLSLDHVLPRAKGGKLTWTNTVTACLDCNFKKGHRTLDELKPVGMRLRALPRVPTSHELHAKAKLFSKGKYHPHWITYVN